MGILDRSFNKINKNIIIDIVINITIAAFVLGIISVQYFFELTILESKLLNFLFIIPLFAADYRYNLQYGSGICAVAMICHFVFPLNMWRISISLPLFAILACQMIIFVLFSLFISSIKKKITDLNSEIKERNERIIRDDDRNNNDIMEILVKVIDAKDSYTYQHSRRVANYAKSLALSAGLSEETADRVYIAGILHDVGKIGLDENILNKSTKLDGNERKEASRHPIIGARIAENLNCFKDVIPAIYYHHEVYDGSGYPEGLKGENIPLAARILSIADAFDAMTSDRSYRVGMPVESAVKRLIENIGNQFDPHLIIAFIDLLKNKSIFVEEKKV